VRPNKRKTLSLFKRSASTADNTSGGSAPYKLFWPEQHLTHDIADARVWTYGYNADVIGIFQANNKNSVSQHGRDLAVRVEREIENEVDQDNNTPEEQADDIRTRSYLWRTASAVLSLKMYVSTI
jgi:hypothetical protein